MSSISSLTAIFSNAQLQMARYLYCPFYIAGNIGNLLNLIVFSQPKLRTSSVCSWYFLAISAANLISINTGYFTRILTYMGLPDPSRTMRWYCTGRVYISVLSLTLGRHFLCSIVIDRFLVTSRSVKLRQLSSFKIAKWYVPLSVLAWMIFYIHIWVGYTDSPLGSACKRQVGAYTVFITISSLVIDAITPIVVMIIFSLLIINNLHGWHQRRNHVSRIAGGTLRTTMDPTITPFSITASKRKSVSERQNHREQKQDGKQLTLISLIQVALYILCNAMNASYALYSQITISDIRSVDRAAIESFINAFAYVLTFMHGTLTFYIYTLASSTYRREFRAAFEQYVTIIQHRFQRK